VVSCITHMPLRAHMPINSHMHAAMHARYMHTSENSQGRRNVS